MICNDIAFNIDEGTHEITLAVGEVAGPIEMDVERQGGGTSDYNELENKPKINGVELVGNLTSEALGIREAIDNHTLVRTNNVLKVNTTDVAEEDNTLPITSAGTYVIVGNIDSLLQSI